MTEDLVEGAPVEEKKDAPAEEKKDEAPAEEKKEEAKEWGVWRNKRLFEHIYVPFNLE